MTKEDFVKQFLQVSLPRGFFTGYDENTGRCVVTFQVRDMTCVPDPVPDVHTSPDRCAKQSVSLITTAIQDLVPQMETQRLMAILREIRDLALAVAPGGPADGLRNDVLYLVQNGDGCVAPGFEPRHLLHRERRDEVVRENVG